MTKKEVFQRNKYQIAFILCGCVFFLFLLHFNNISGEKEIHQGWVYEEIEYRDDTTVTNYPFSSSEIIKTSQENSISTLSFFMTVFFFAFGVLKWNFKKVFIEPCELEQVVNFDFEPYYARLRENV